MTFRLIKSVLHRGANGPRQQVETRMPRRSRWKQKRWTRMCPSVGRHHQPANAFVDGTCGPRLWTAPVLTARPRRQEDRRNQMTDLTRPARPVNPVRPCRWEGFQVGLPRISLRESRSGPFRQVQIRRHLRPGPIPVDRVWI